MDFLTPTVATVELWELRGTKVRSWEIQKEQYYRNSFSVNGLPAGVYILKVSTEQGSIRQRLVVH